MKTINRLGILLLLPASIFAQTKSVLFIGNSYTGVNNLPVMTKDLALSLNDTLVIDANTPGGTTFNSHTGNATSLAKIGQGSWDYVVLQAQSQEPSFPPAQVAAQTYPYAAILVDSIRSANECTIPLFYMTWGRQNGDAGNCASYPVICDYDGMQGRLRESYLEMALDNDAEVSPVGAAWKYVRDNHPTLNLYNADESHPNAAGSYLAACVHYASIYKKSPVGATYTFSLNASDAAILQNAAKLIVMDSLANWNFRTDIIASDFTSVATTGMEFQFTNTSQNSTDYLWDFGDGLTSSLENPSHLFNTDGTYTVTLISTNSCDAVTTTNEIQVFGNNVLELRENGYNIQQIDQVIKIQNDNLVNATIQLISIEGKVLKTKIMNGNSTEIEAPKTQGVFLLALTDNETGQTTTKKLINQ